MVPQHVGSQELLSAHQMPLLCACVLACVPYQEVGHLHGPHITGPTGCPQRPRSTGSSSPPQPLAPFGPRCSPVLAQYQGLDWALVMQVQRQVEAVVDVGLFLRPVVSCLRLACLLLLALRRRRQQLCTNPTMQS